MTTPLHPFQFFVENYEWMVPRDNNVFNNNGFNDTKFFVGANIKRLIDVQKEDLGDMIFKRK